MKGVAPQLLVLYAKVWLFLTTLIFKTIKNFSVKSDISMEKHLIEEDNFNEGGAGLSSIIWKSNKKINMKSFFDWK